MVTPFTELPRASILGNPDSETESLSNATGAMAINPLSGGPIGYAPYYTFG
jgi:hypothetical protein